MGSLALGTRCRESPDDVARWDRHRVVESLAALRSIPTSTARTTRSSSASISDSAKARLCG